MFRDILNDIDNYSLVADTYLDVPFVPTDEEAVAAMLRLAKVNTKDIVYDLGSGDGRLLIAAAKERGARGIGIEIDPARIADAMEYAGWAGVKFTVDFIEGDIFTTDFSEATVVFLYLFESVNVQLRPRLLAELQPGSRIVSHAFSMGHWKADDWIKLNGAVIYKWIVPADIAGIWEWEQEEGKRYRIELEQEFQEVSGSAWLEGKQIKLKSAVLSGGQLELTLHENNSTPPRRFILNFSHKHLHSVKEI